MDSILIWADRPSGRDPTTHFWFEVDSVRYCLCNGSPWTAAGREPSAGDAPFVPCHSCKEIYLEDVLHGQQVLTILPEPPAPDIVGYTPNNGVYPTYPERHMPRIPLSSFARFYEVRPADQVRIVRDIRNRLMNPDDYMGRDFYGPLRQTMRRTHWATGDIGTFEDALGPLVDSQQVEARKDHYRRIGERYIDFWKSRDASYFPVMPVDVDLSDLTIVVSPEVGMRAGGDYQALKLWFNAEVPTRQARQVVVHLMNRANVQSDQWQTRWHSGIWDIRRGNIPLPVNPARDFELGLVGQVAAFLRIWEDLDEQAQRAIAEA